MRFTCFCFDKVCNGREPEARGPYFRLFIAVDPFCHDHGQTLEFSRRAVLVSTRVEVKLQDLPHANNT